MLHKLKVVYPIVRPRNVYHYLFRFFFLVPAVKFLGKRQRFAAARRQNDAIADSKCKTLCWGEELLLL